MPSSSEQGVQDPTELLRGKAKARTLSHGMCICPTSNTAETHRRSSQRSTQRTRQRILEEDIKAESPAKRARYAAKATRPTATPPGSLVLHGVHRVCEKLLPHRKVGLPFEELRDRLLRSRFRALGRLPAELCWRVMFAYVSEFWKKLVPPTVMIAEPKPCLLYTSPSPRD